MKGYPHKMTKSVQPDHKAYMLTCGSDTAVVLVHGILGSPAQLRFLAEALCREGFDCHALLLPGHGGSGGVFSATQFGEWQRHVCDSVQACGERYRKLYLIGHSLGGLLCLQASLERDIAGIVLLNTPLAFKISLKQLAVSFRVLFSSPEKDDPMLSAYREAKSVSNGRLHQYPLWLRQFVSLIRTIEQTKRILQAVNAKTLIIQSIKDESVAKRSPAMLRNGMSKSTSQVVPLPASCHCYFTEPDRQRMIGEIVRFIKE